MLTNPTYLYRESSGLDIKAFEPLEGTSNKDPKNWIACSGFEESVIRLGYVHTIMYFSIGNCKATNFFIVIFSPTDRRDDGTNNNVKATIIPMVEEDLFSAAAD